MGIVIPISRHPRFRRHATLADRIPGWARRPAPDEPASSERDLPLAAGEFLPLTVQRRLAVVPPPARRTRRRLRPWTLAVLLAATGLTVVSTLIAGRPAAGQPTATPRPVYQAEPRTGYQWPLPGQPRVVRPFDPPPQPWLAGHRGVDLVGQAGEPVLAAGSGTVAFAGQVAGTGVVSIDHTGGLRTTYQPLVPSVHAGQHVVAGQRIGTLLAGHPGCPVSACLHWGLRRGESYLDPLTLLGLGQVRLLPLDGTQTTARSTGASDQTPRHLAARLPRDPGPARGTVTRVDAPGGRRPAASPPTRACRSAS